METGNLVLIVIEDLISIIFDLRQNELSQKNLVEALENTIEEWSRQHDIETELVISEKTVKSHVSNILNKLHLADRTQAAVYAWREGIIRRDDA